MIFLPYQRRFIEDPSQLKILEKSRRIGGSFAVSYSVFRKLLKLKNHDVTVVTRDQATGVEFVRDVHRFARAWNLKNPSKAIPESCMNKTGFSVPHPQGESRLLMVSSNPDAAAGRGGSLVLDEMALHRDPELLLTVAMPVITAGGDVTILSTHRSKSSAFNRLIEETKAGKLNFSLHKTTIYDAIDQGFVETVVNPTRQKNGFSPLTRDDFIRFIKDDVCLGDPNRFEQEYLAIPSEAQYNLLSYDLISMAVDDILVEPEECFLGWDIATSEAGDFSSISIISRDKDNMVHLVHQEQMRGEDLHVQRERIISLVKRYKVRKLALDSTGIGTDSAQILTRKYGEKMCEGVHFTLQSKNEMASRILSCFQMHKIKIPNDPPLHKDLNSVEKIYSKSGNVTYQAPRIDGSHGDMFWSLALALRACGWDRTGLVPRGLGERKPVAGEWLSRVERNRKEDNKRNGRAF